MQIKSQESNNDSTIVNEPTEDLKIEITNSKKEMNILKSNTTNQRNETKVNDSNEKLNYGNNENYIMKNTKSKKFYAIFIAIILLSFLSGFNFIVEEDMYSDENIYFYSFYILSITVLQPIYGKFSSLFSRRTMLYLALLFFFIGSIMLYVISDDDDFTNTDFIFPHFIQGIGVGGFLSLSLIIMDDIIPVRQRGKFMSIPLVVFTCSPAAFWLIDNQNFSSNIFLLIINIVLSIAIFLIILKYGNISNNIGITRTNSQRMKFILNDILQIDYIGISLFLIGASCLLVLILYIDKEDINIIYLILLGSISIFSLLLFFVNELKTKKDALIPMEIFKNRNICCMLIGAFLLGIGFSGIFFLHLPNINFDMIKILIIPTAMIMVFLNMGSGFIIGKWGYVIYIFVGGLMLSALSGGMSFLLEDNNDNILYILLIAFCGIIATLIRQNMILVIQDSTPKGKVTITTTLFIFMHGLGSIIGIKINYWGNRYYDEDNYYYKYSTVITSILILITMLSTKKIKLNEKQMYTYLSETNISIKVVNSNRTSTIRDINSNRASTIISIPLNSSSYINYNNNDTYTQNSNNDKY